MSEIQTDEAQPSDFARALNSMMDNLENVVVNFQNTLVVMLEKIERLESTEKSSKDDVAPNETNPITEQTKQLTNDATASTEMPHQKLSETQNENTTVTDARINLQRSENGIQDSTPAMTTESDTIKRSILTGSLGKIIKKISSKSNYFILVIALVILGVIIFRLFSMLLL
ncbi:MAG: hypothetical protein OEX77_06615 [Candidatus Bathyarchaeota archaeon]|nr:hypothetical protein [Candidatus Bathyarchaeota archaeon]MDH5733525.1 hypothetical protein [Candidatus Bathyarchaeota archaeon]